MSVINQMLRDLDKQRGIPAASSRVVPATPRSKLWLLVILLLLVILGQHFWLADRSSENSGNAAISAVMSGASLSGASQPATTTPQARPQIDEHAAALLARGQPQMMNDSDVVVAKPSTLALAAGANGDTELERVAGDPELRGAPAATTIAEVQSPEAAAAPTPSALVQTAKIISPSAQADYLSVDSAASVESATSLSPDSAEEPVTIVPEESVAKPVATVQRISPEQQSLMWQEQTEQALAEGRYAEAEQLLRQWRSVDPQQALPLFAELFWQRQQSLELDAAIAESQQLGIFDVRVQRLHLYRLQQQQRWQELLALINDQLLASYNTEVIALQAQALWQTQQYQAALIAYQQWTKLAPNEARAWLGQALVLEQLTQPQAARAAYQQALQQGGLSPASLQFIQQRLVAMPE